MKELEIVIKPERLETLKEILQECDATGLMISSIMGYGNQKGMLAQYRGTQYSVNLLPKITVRTITTDAKAQEIVDNVCAKMAKEDIGGGKIFIKDIADVVRIRTGEHGEDAL